MAKSNDDKAILYLYLVEKMAEHVSPQKEIRIVKAEWILSRYRVPHNLRIPILKEMQKQGLLEPIDKFRMKIAHESKIQENTSLLYHRMGLW